MTRDYLATIIQYQLAAFVFLLPLFFLPNFGDFYQLPKTLLIVLFASSLLVTTGIYYWQKKTAFSAQTRQLFAGGASSYSFFSWHLFPVP